MESWQPLTGRAARFAQRYPAPPLVAAGEEMVSTAADEFQLLAFKLRSWAAQHENAKVFVVASAVGGEGKSFIALNLAAALAVSGSGTLLIDADIRAPFQHYAFPVPKVDGLLGYLQGTTGTGYHHTADACTGLEPDALGRNQQSRAGIPGFGQDGSVDGNGEAQHRLPVHHNRYAAGACWCRMRRFFRRAADGTIIVTAADSTARAATTKTFLMFDPQTLFGVVLNRFKPSYSTVRSERYGRYGRYGTIRALREILEVLEILEIRGSRCERMTDGAFSLSPPGSFPLSADPAFQDEVRRELERRDRARPRIAPPLQASPAFC